MNDWFDKVLSTLGLDDHRMDRALGVVERKLIELDAPQSREPVKVNLNRLADGRRLLLFQVGSHRKGELWPLLCSRANADALGQFLRRAESHLRPLGTPEPPGQGVVESLWEWLLPGRPVEVMAPLAHRYLDTRMELRLLANRSGGHSLLLVTRGPRCRFHYRWRWSPALAAKWQTVLAGLQDSLPSVADPDVRRC